MSILEARFSAFLRCVPRPTLLARPQDAVRVAQARVIFHANRGYQELFRDALLKTHNRGANYFWNLVYKCPEIRPKIPEIPVIREIWRKISEIRLGNHEIWCKIPEKLSFRREIPGIWPETFQIRPEIPKICSEIPETRL